MIVSDRPWWSAGARIIKAIESIDEAPFRLVTGAASMGCNPGIVDVAVIPRVMDSSECSRVLAAARSTSFERGRTLGGVDETRQCYCAWIPPERDHEWIYDRVAQAFATANRKFRFRLEGLIEPVMAVAYDPGDRIDWHLDTGPELTANRKLSLSLFLTEPGVHDGGVLEFAGMAPLPSPVPVGTATVFPSFLAHRVTPVTRGRRLSLVAFAYGPTFS